MVIGIMILNKPLIELATFGLIQKQTTKERKN